MASTREIKERISSIEDTRKITNAMYLLSSTKLRKAKKSLEDTEPFFYNLQAMIQRVLRHVPDFEHRYFESDEDKKKTVKKRGFIVVTADKGLAGAYNHNVLKMVESQIEDIDAYQLYVVGEVGRQYFLGKGYHIEEHFQYTAQDPHLGRARTIANRVLEQYENDVIDELYVVYTDMRNNMVMETQMIRLLPLQRSDFYTHHMLPANVRHEEFIFEPSPEAVIDYCVPSYMTGFIHGALVESFCCEQYARMVAMQAANDSGQKMLKELNIQYNRVRQAKITQEITEVISGARAQKSKEVQG